MTAFLQAGLGALAAAALMLASRSSSPERQRQLWAVALVVAALIYVGFAAFGAAPAPWLMLELGGVAAYAALAFLSLRFSPWLLAFGWLAHAAWDTIVHPGPPPFVPAWYPPVCIGFDLAVAVFIALELTRHRRPA